MILLCNISFLGRGGEGTVSDQGGLRGDGDDDINGEDNDGNVCRFSLCTPRAGVNLTFPIVSNLFLWVVLVRLVGGCLMLVTVKMTT